MTRDKQGRTPQEPAAATDADAERLRAALGYPTADDLLRAAPPWREHSADPSPGQIRLGPAVGDGESSRRDLFVLVGEPFEDFGRRWWTAMALDTEVAAAAAADAVIRPGETELAIGLRLRTDHVAPVPDEELGGVVAALDPAVLEAVEHGTLEQARFGLDYRGRADWRLEVDPHAWRRWLERRRAYELELTAFEAAEARLERRWLELYREAGDALRRMLLSVFGYVPAPGGATPAAAFVQAIAERLEALSPQADVALAGADDLVATPEHTFWPVSLHNRRELHAAIEPSGPGARIRIAGLPAEIEGLHVVVCLPMAVGAAGAAAAWYHAAPGLLITEAPVRGGEATVALDRVASPDVGLLRDLVVLPPFDAADGDDDA